MTGGLLVDTIGKKLKIWWLIEQSVKVSRYFILSNVTNYMFNV